MMDATITYTTQRGDTISGIAAKLRVEERAVETAASDASGLVVSMEDGIPLKYLLPGTSLRVEFERKSKVS